MLTLEQQNKNRRFARFLRAERKKRKITQVQLAKYLKCSPQYICDVESGRRGVPRNERLYEIAKLFEMEFATIALITGQVDFPEGIQPEDIEKINIYADAIVTLVNTRRIVGEVKRLSKLLTEEINIKSDYPRLLSINVELSSNLTDLINTIEGVKLPLSTHGEVSDPEDPQSSPPLLR